MKQKKFRRQLHKWDCAIICLVNCLVFLKKDFSFAPQYAWFKYVLKADETGVLPSQFDKIIKGLFSNVRKKVNPDILYLQKEINNKNLVVLGADYSGLNHVGLIIKLNKRHATLVNWGPKYPVKRKITIKQLKELMSEWSCVWVVENS